ncbi:acyl carrier protein [Streptomyces sp. AK02-04a]|uniref:acyl carrier protein n=1 Tax=Streptomyces sp. AK02-04a TaxID=3028649 RepID=UPI0029A4E94C|nr:acyl carrier protein [Streptomyces sp. AK02-04a]MDX3763696.1 acyl carrier protein [Streptomyces sp. AK02-04a]
MTTAASLRESLEQMLTGKFQVDPAGIVEGATLTDLGLDSLAVVELIDALATDLKLQLEDDALHPAMTVDEAVAALRQGNAK